MCDIIILTTPPNCLNSAFSTSFRKIKIYKTKFKGVQGQTIDIKLVVNA